MARRNPKIANTLLVSSVMVFLGSLVANLAGLGVHGAWVFVAGLVAALTFVWYRQVRISLTLGMLIAMVLGVTFGYFFPAVSADLDVVSKVFLKLIKTSIAPLLLGTLIVGIAGHTDLKSVGRMGIKSLIYFELVTTVALAIGLFAINLTQAGNDPAIQIPPDLSLPQNLAAPKGWKDIVLHSFPDNIAKSIADGEVLQVVVFAVLFAIGAALLPADKRRPILVFAESLSEVMFKFVRLVMYLAPLAVGAAMAVTVGKLGLEAMRPLGLLLLTLYGALVVFVLIVLVPIALSARIPLTQFWKAVREPAGIAFATTSSEAALPSALQRMERFGVPKHVVAFVLPTGYSFNLDGTTLYLSLASVFVAQVAGIELSIGQQIVMCLTLMLTSKGVAGVPRASFVILVGTIAAFGIPPETALVVMGVDAVMDMARTAINVTGNCLASCVVARWEGVFEDEKAKRFTDDLAPELG
jgi:proton glutamate symport protein